MHHGKFSHARVVELTIIGIVAAVIIGIALIHWNDKGPGSSRSTAESAPAAASPNMTAALSTPSQNAPTPSIPVGGLIPLASASPGELSLRLTDEAPLITEQQAKQAIAKIGVPWALADNSSSSSVRVRATYGVGTFGQPGVNGAPWIGDRNIPLPDGERLDHVEGRPMWIIDYKGPKAYGGGCPGCPPDVYDHTVYAVDGQSDTVLKIWFYNDGTSADGGSDIPTPEIPQTK
ncbi:MAG TPA: hypothetical protein VKU87_05165 [Thermomicrobiaceae bacterium]|nr:hypothetical protein [Thermomicrobiaceae bacterium]